MTKDTTYKHHIEAISQRLITVESTITKHHDATEKLTVEIPLYPFFLKSSGQSSPTGVYGTSAIRTDRRLNARHYDFKIGGSR